MYDDNPDEPHDTQEEGTYAEFKFTFSVTPTDDGMMQGELAHVQSHIHHIPDHVVIDALLITARNMLVKSQMNVFSAGIPDEIRESLTNGFATMLLKQRLDSPEVTGAGLDSVVIPNDIRELLDD